MRGLKEKNHRLMACEKTLRKAMKKNKRWKGIRMPINSKKGKRSFNGKKTQQMPKVNTKKKSSFMSFGVSRIKSLVSSKKIRLVIHQRKSWICIMTYVKRILIFEINKVICHFLYKDNERKRY
jgi:deoxyribodipyrimidine photolyase